jgi:hypothetical protein
LRHYTPRFDIILKINSDCVQGCTQERRRLLPGCRTPKNLNLKNKDFLETMISDFVRDLPFNQNQILKTADD